MQIASYILFAAAILSYLLLRPQVSRLIAESRQAHPERRFGRLYWDPAWMAHRVAYPESGLRQAIALRFWLTFLLVCIAMALMLVAYIHAHG